MTTLEASTKSQQTAGGEVVYMLLDMVVPNRYQRRQPGDVSSLAENIQAHSLKQYPIGRWHPDQPGVIELADGHRRTAAFRKLWADARAKPAGDDPAKWAVIPIVVQDLTDRQMFETCIIANEQREALSAIERAVSLRDYMAEFKVSQTEAGKLFTTDQGGPLSQAAVSKLIGLLALPDAVQDLVRRRELAEVPARGLVRLVDWRPDLVLDIAAETVKEPEPGKRAGRAETLIDEALRRNAQLLDDDSLRPWPLEWPGKPEKVPMALFMANRPSDGTHQTIPAEVPACKGCEFNLERHGQHYCLRLACFVTKRAMWDAREVTRVAEKLGIAAAAPGEKTSIIYPVRGYSYALNQQTERLVAAKLPELRIVARPRNAQGEPLGDGWGLKDTLGSESVALATVNQGAISVYLAKGTGAKSSSKVPEKKANETPAQTERRKVAEVELREENALKRTAYNRARADVLWLVEHTAELIAERTVAGGGLLVLAEHLTQRFFSVGLDEMKATQGRLAQLADVGTEKFEKMLAHKAGPATPETDKRRRQLMAYTVLASEVAGYKNATEVYADFEKARATVKDVATKTFGVELPVGWATPPVHHTPINCWQCGRFSSTGSGQLNQNDLREGWREAWETANGQPTQGAALQSVLCPSHAYFQSPGKGYGYPGATSQQKALESYDRAVKALAKLTPADRAAAAMRANLVKLEILSKPASNKCTKCGKPMIGKGPICINCLQSAETDVAAKATAAVKPADTGLGWVVTGICTGPLVSLPKLIKTADVAALDAARDRMKNSDLGANGGNRARLDLVEAELKLRKQAAIVTKTATRKATAAAASLASKAAYGRSHTRPAPKPAAAKRRKVAKKGK